MALLIIILVCYLAHIFWRSALSTTRIVDIEDGVYQVYTCGQSIGYCTTQLLVATVFLDFLGILTRWLGAYFSQSNRIIVNWLGFFFL